MNGDLKKSVDEGKYVKPRGLDATQSPDAQTTSSARKHQYREYLLPGFLSGVLTILTLLVGYLLIGQYEAGLVMEKSITERVTRELSALQAKIAEIELSTKLLQKEMELKRDEIATAEIIADLITKVAPTAKVMCKGEWRIDSNNKETNEYLINCNIANNGSYPFFVDVRFDDATETSLFDTEGYLIPSGRVEPNQEISGGNKLIFDKKFVKEFHGHYRISLAFEIKTIDEIVDAITESIENAQQQQMIKDRGAIVSIYSFDLYFN